MLRQALLASALVTLVSVPSFLIGQRLRHADLSAPMLLALVGLTACLVLLASSIMRSLDR